MYAGSVNYRSIQCAHTLHTDGGEATNLWVTPSIRRTRRQSAWMRCYNNSSLIFLHFDSPKSICPATSSNHQQDLPASTFFSRGMSLARVAEWKLLAYGNAQFAVSDCFGHVLEDLHIRRCEHRHNFHR